MTSPQPMTVITISRTTFRKPDELNAGNRNAYLLARLTGIVNDPKLDSATKRQAIDDVVKQLAANPDNLEDTQAINAMWLTLGNLYTRDQIMAAAARLALFAHRLRVANEIKDADRRYALIETAVADFASDKNAMELSQHVAALADLAEKPPFATPTTGQPAATNAATPAPAPTGLPVSPLTPNLGNAATTQP